MLLVVSYNSSSPRVGVQQSLHIIQLVQPGYNNNCAVNSLFATDLPSARPMM